MAMKYFLWLAAIGPHPRLPLSKQEYGALRKAWDTILALLSFEEEFDSIIQNYIDLELGFLNTAMHFMIITETDLKEYRRVRLKFARLLANLLASCRSYLDHSPHHL